MELPDKYIEKYGTRLSYKVYGVNYSIKGIIQPFHYSYKSYFDTKRFESGAHDGRHYLMILKSTMASVIHNNMDIYQGDKVYRIKTYEPYRYKGEIIYVRALATARTET